MSGPAVERASERVYSGVWAVLVHGLKVPQSGPSLPGSAVEGGRLEVFHPAPGFLRYLKLWFWIGLTLFDGLLTIAWVALLFGAPIVAWILLVPFLVIGIVPDILAYIAIHVRYDTTWYAMNDRALRIRRGIWIIHETTFTFENVQNVRVVSGPIQRAFGISNLEIETAGSGESEQSGSITNKGLIEGVSDAARIRDLIMTKVRASKSSGLGDDKHDASAKPSTTQAAWSPAHLAALRDIASEIRSSVHGEAAD